MSSYIQTSHIHNNDLTDQLVSQVQSAYQNRQALAIQGNGSKLFLIHQVPGQRLSTASHQGIVNYLPSELTITVRSGTLLSDLKEVLTENGQMLAFEPPQFSANATIGGTIAAGLSGPSRPFTGSARDFVLGCKIINGRGELLQFGGEVMKNVAGYDLSRLVTGSYGSLGLILEVSLKLLPLPSREQSISFPLQLNQFAHQVQRLLLSGYPITAACYLDGQAYIRLAGSEKGVASSYQEISQLLSKQKFQPQEINNLFWSELNEQQLSFFDQTQPLWRLSLPGKTENFERYISAEDKQLIDWGGALRWFYSNQSADKIRSDAQSLGGHAQLFRGNEMDSDELKNVPKQQPLTPAIMKIHQQIKRAMDPHLILNHGCLYPEL
ncbi:MAG: glycolate oxidase subunit GlcE [Gammaproteobacteria bacterium]|nr:glycolate oxidase subunit GlcE [Gammaproteobacteria bacterium]